MTTSTAEDLYDLVLKLPVPERLRLVEKIARDLEGTTPAALATSDSSRLAGAAPAPRRGVLPTLPRDAWEAALGSIALGGDALVDSEAYYDGP